MLNMGRQRNAAPLLRANSTQHESNEISWLLKKSFRYLRHVDLLTRPVG